MPGTFAEELGVLLKARFPLLYVESFEESRVLAQVRAVAGQGLPAARPVYVWSVTEGIRTPTGDVVEETSDPRRALDWALDHQHPAVFVFCDLHAHLGSDVRSADAALIRRLRDIASSFARGQQARTLIVVAPVLRIPPELEKDLYIVDFALPGVVEIRRILDNIIGLNSGGRISPDLDEDGKERLVKAALGLTEHEVESAFARAMVAGGVLQESDVELVLAEKRQVVRKTGVLEFLTSDLDLDDVGGLENLKAWLGRRNNSWMEEATRYGVPAPKGALITGVPGCGKSLTAKAIASAWGLPLLRMDVGRVFAGLVGSSEQNMRSAIRSAEAAAPCVLWIDEIEKAFAGVVGSSGDSGTSSRVFGTFLTWMQEKRSHVFVIATANNVASLPPEFLRKGRFDEIFFVDLPTQVERVAIWRIQIGRYVMKAPANTDFPNYPALWEELATLSEGYSGAEIEQAVIAALYQGFADRRPITPDDLKREITDSVPLSVTQAEQVQALRTWAESRTVSASTADA
ncbi:AAA family ATPase [Nocardioides limicola]|uniref:AAA family ATPase n=1 Tax=Nocardioides limicola TaxID=2803368 RepID=UPI00193BD8AD|nr:AAA family ATPase [Nocardioides sp. DJM-14]